MWDYMFMIDYLREKKKKVREAVSEFERNIIEKLVNESEDQKWFPCFYDYEAENEQNVENEQNIKDVSLQCI